VKDPLASFPLFAHLTRSDRKTLLDYLEERSYEDDSRVFGDGEEASEMLLVAEGEVRIETGGEVRGRLGKGEAIGGLSLVAIGRRACAARSAGPLRVFALSREAYMRLRTDAPPLALALQESIIRRFAGALRSALSDVPGG
jgi:CRP-like cAMP-binding protein